MTDQPRAAPSLSRMAEVYDVSILNDVFLALEPKLRVFTACGQRTALQQRLTRDDLRANEAALNVAVNLAGGQLRVRAARDRPGAIFVFTHREKRNVAEQ